MVGLKLTCRAVPLLLNDFNPPAKPVPLHGDLWAGNVCHTSSGGVIFDPAGYYGHGEADLGIARMFGGESPHGRPSPPPLARAKAACSPLPL